jgi:hypothetical protein
MNSPEHPKEVGSAVEFLVCASLLPALRERCASTFNLLEIPEVLRVDEHAGRHGTVFFRRYVGRTYNDRWNEGIGGAMMGTELSEDMVRVIGDFRRIDIGWVLAHPVGRGLGESAFNIDQWLTSFRSHHVTLIDWGFSAPELRRAEELVGRGFELQDRILSNGDFYARNLIRTDSRLVVVDWGHWDGNRVCFLDYLPNVVAFAFNHMWNNDEWQERFLHHAQETLGVKVEDLRRAILIKAFEQAIFWKDTPYWPPQVRHLRMALENRLPLH